MATSHSTNGILLQIALIYPVNEISIAISGCQYNGDEWNVPENMPLKKKIRFITI